MSIEEQQQTTPEAAATEMSERDQLIAAVREAGGTESVDVEQEQAVAEAQTETTQAAPAAPAAEPPPEDRLGVILKAREKAHAEREAARASASSTIEDARREAKRIIEESRAESKRAAEDESAARRARFAASPIEALRELGDPQAVVDAALRHGSPEARAQAALEQQLRETQAIARDGKGAREELAQFRRDLEQQQRQQLIAQAQQQFLSSVATAEKAPYLHAIADSPAGVWEKCDQLCRQWQQDGLVLNGSGETGFDQSDLVQYLEQQSREKLSKFLPATTPAQQVAAGAPSKAPGIAPQVSANGPRTLSAAQGSERRTSPKPLSEMTSDQARSALIEAAAEARRNNPDAAF